MNVPFLLIHLAPPHWALAGASIGGITTLSFVAGGILTTQVLSRVLYTRLQSAFRLPPVTAGTGEG
jgi:hypothetical protein